MTAGAPPRQLVPSTWPDVAFNTGSSLRLVLCSSRSSSCSPQGEPLLSHRGCSPFSSQTSLLSCGYFLAVSWRVPKVRHKSHVTLVPGEAGTRETHDLAHLSQVATLWPCVQGTVAWNWLWMWAGAQSRSQQMLQQHVGKAEGVPNTLWVSNRTNVQRLRSSLAGGRMKS